MTSPSANDLNEALAGMTWRFEPGDFALLGFAEEPTTDDLAAVCRGPAQLVREGGETTLLVRAEELAAARERHPSARVEEGLAWVRFELAMGWDVVGFLARVTGALAEAEVPLGAVCGFSRDHLFVARRFEERTRSVLERTFGPERATG